MPGDALYAASASYSNMLGILRAVFQAQYHSDRGGIVWHEEGSNASR